MNIGYDKPLYIQPFDHRGSFQTKLFGWKGKLTEDQTAQIAARDKKTTREEAVAEIARRYREFVNAFDTARAV